MSDPSTPAAEPLASPGLSGGTLTEERTDSLLEPGDHERFSHFVRKEKIVESAVTGEPVIALCGKVWVPSRDPSRYPVCPDCKAIYEGLNPGKGDDSGDSGD